MERKLRGDRKKKRKKKILVFDILKRKKNI